MNWCYISISYLQIISWYILIRPNHTFQLSFPWTWPNLSPSPTNKISSGVVKGEGFTAMLAPWSKLEVAHLSGQNKPFLCAETYHRQLKMGNYWETFLSFFCVSKSWLCEKAIYVIQDVWIHSAALVPRAKIPTHRPVNSIPPRCLESTCLWLLRGVPVLLTCNREQYETNHQRMQDQAPVLTCNCRWFHFFCQGTQRFARTKHCEQWYGCLKKNPTKTHWWRHIYMTIH